MTEPFTPAVSFTPQETEASRLERLHRVAEEDETTIEELSERFAPGSFGCHEALQMTSVFMDNIGRHLCEHPSILLKPHWYALADQAQTALYNLYQAIGEDHLNADDDVD